MEFKIGDVVRLIPAFEKPFVYEISNSMVLSDGELAFEITNDEERAVATPDTLVLVHAL